MGLFSKIFNFLKSKPRPTAARSNPEADRRADRRENDRLIREAENLTEFAKREAGRQLDRFRLKLDQMRQEDEKQRREEKQREQNERDPEWRYLHLQEWEASPQSSNVAGFRYLLDDGALEVEFKDGSFYQYRPVSEVEALSLYRAGSKGTWIWDNLRIRGTALGHRKDYVWLGGPSRAQRKWDTSDERRAAHDAQRARESEAKLLEPTTRRARRKPKGNTGRRPRS